jgi:endoglucanase
MAQKALKAGLPVIVSEFNICEASGGGAIDGASAAAWRELIEEYGLSYMSWNLSNADETAALIRADCGRTADWTEDELSDTGRWLRSALRDDREKERSKRQDVCSASGRDFG